MSDAPKPVTERELQTNIHRVATNALVLLDIGLFPGKHSIGLSEVKEFLAALQADALNKMNSLTPAPAIAPAPSAAPIHPTLVPPPAAA